MKMKLIALITLLISAHVQAGIIPSHEQQIQLNISQGLAQLQTANGVLIGRIFNAIWKDKTVLPCQVWTDLGANAAPLRAAFSNFIAFINSQGGTIAISEPAGFTMTNNSNGTVTCVAPTPSPSPSPSDTP